MFIHTFAMAKTISDTDFNHIIDIYKRPENRNRMISPRDGRHEKEIIEYCYQGIRILLRFRSEPERRYDKDHLANELIVIVTPYKLLYPEEAMGELTNAEFMDSLEELKKMLGQISEKIGIMLDNLAIGRIDISQDVETPNVDYSDTILDVQRYFPLPTGYIRYVPTPEKIRNGWNDEYSYLFYNQRKGLFFKTYDKLFELEERGIPYELPHGHGLLRYEISMIRKFLAKKYGNLIDDSYALLAEVNHDKEFLMGELYSLPFAEQGMVSAPIMKKLVAEYTGGKGKTCSQMMDFAKQATGIVRFGHDLDHMEDLESSPKKRRRLLKKFKEAGILPIKLDADFPYIPSIKEQIMGRYNKQLLKFAKKNTRKKVYWNE